MKNKLLALLLFITLTLLSFTSCGEEEYVFDYYIPIVDEDGLTGETFNPADNIGRIMIINFWGVWCPYCLDEMPDLDTIAEEYADTVTVIAVHSDHQFEDCSDYIDDNFEDSKIIFGKDEPYVNGDVFYSMLGGTGSYPMTVVINKNGEISDTFTGRTHYLNLQLAINRASK